MKKSHKWIKCVEARCPYCHSYLKYMDVGEEDDLVGCRDCGKTFRLGEQK